MASENLAVLITGSGRDLINEFKKVGDEAEKSGKKTASGWDKAKSGIKMAGAAIAGTAVAVGVASIEMADKYEGAHARLETALKNTGTSWEKQKKQIDSVSRSAVEFGYTKTDVEGALSGMVTGMGSSAKAVKAFQLAEDLAAAKGIDLATAGMMVTKASQGQIKPLKALGIDLPVAAGGALKVKKANDALAKSSDALKLVQAKIHDGLLKGPSAYLALAAAQDKVQSSQDKVNSTAATGDTILDALGKRLGGSAAAQAETFAGKTKALKAQLNNVAITIGMALMPILIKMANFLTQKVIPFFQKHTVYAKGLAIVLGVTLVAAAGLYTASMVAAAAATLAATWPILAVVAAIGLVGLAMTKLGVKWGNVWAGMKIWYDRLHLQGAVDGLKIAIQDIGTAAQLVADNWEGIWSGIVNTVIDSLNQIVRVYNDTVAIITRHKIEAIGAYNAASSAPAPQKSPMGPFLPGHNPDAGGYGPTLPKRARGGSMMPFSSYLVGEKGPEVLTMGGSSGFMHPNAGGGAVVVNVHLNGFAVGTDRQLGQKLSDELIKYMRGTGKRWLAQ